jgi:hypothetical protein
MSTTRILLPNEEAVLPTSNPATLTKVTGTGTAPTNAPVVTANKLTFDQTTDQTGMWTFRLPSDYLSGGSVFIKWSADVNTGAVIWKAGIAAIVDGVTNLLSVAAFNAADLSATVTVPGTIGFTTETSWGLTATGVLASQLVCVFIGRRAGAAGDTAAGNANLWAAEFEYTS